MKSEDRETRHEEIARLQREIGERQARLYFLVLGDPLKSVTLQAQIGANDEPVSK